MPLKRETNYPNACKDWHGCPMTCPDSCPFEDCTMPSTVAARIQPPVWHGWIVDEDGAVVRELRSYCKKGATA